MSTTERPTPAREALSARWNELTRVVLPEMAREQQWPISFDHCFMRVCLDSAVGVPWHATVARPAILHMSDEQLATAVRTAEAIVVDPDKLVRLNDFSLSGRRALRTRRGKPLPIAPAGDDSFCG